MPLLRSFLYDLLIGARLRKLKNFEAAECPPPIARRPRTEVRLISNALFFSEELKTELARICLVRRTAFILALDSPGRTKSMLSRYIFHDLDSSLAIDKIQTRPVSQAAFRSIR